MLLCEYRIVRQEYDSAMFVYQDLCSVAERRLRYGRFSGCDEVRDLLSVDNLWVRAFDRACMNFVTQMNFKILLLICLVLCFALYVFTFFNRIMYRPHRTKRTRALRS